MMTLPLLNTKLYCALPGAKRVQRPRLLAHLDRVLQPGSRLLLVCAPAAPLLYTAIVIFGAAIRPGYSHIQYAISELAAAGVPNKSLMDILLSIYNLLVMAFAVGMFRLAAHHRDYTVKGSGQWVCLFWPAGTRDHRQA